MSSKTKIVVLRMKEIIYTAIFLGLASFLISLFLIMFRPKKELAVTQTQSSVYIPGVYSASLVLGSQNVNVEVSVNADRISSISMVTLDDSVTTMYPLMQPALEDLAKQICDTQSTQNLSYPMETRYTSNALIQTIDTALAKAQIK